MELDQTRIEDAIIKEVADGIISNENLCARVKRAVDERIDLHFRTVADQQITSAIEDAVHQGFEHEYCRVNSFGQREGEPTTIRAELQKMIGGYWNTIVDNQGKPTSSSYGKTMNRAEWLMTQLVASDFKGEMQQHVVNLGGMLKDRLRAELYETVNRLLSEVFHVKSTDDQQGKRQDRSAIDPPQKPAA